MEPHAQDPSTRLQNVVEFANSFKIDNRIPIRRLLSKMNVHIFKFLIGLKLHLFYRYFRSGKEMLRMADVYNKEGNYENAYTLYLKFLT